MTTTSATVTETTRATPKAVNAQQRWYHAARGERVSVRLTDGKTITGVLCAYDPYCLVVEVPGQPAPALVYKHAVTYVLRTGSTGPPNP